MLADANHSEDPTEPSSGPERFRILALDGGGAKALFSAHVLARLEEDLDVRVADSFDLIAGGPPIGSGTRPGPPR